MFYVYWYENCGITDLLNNPGNIYNFINKCELWTNLNFNRAKLAHLVSSRELAFLMLSLDQYEQSASIVFNIRTAELFITNSDSKSINGLEYKRLDIMFAT